jgi:hypothetical protein
VDGKSRFDTRDSIQKNQYKQQRLLKRKNDSIEKILRKWKKDEN